MDINIGQMWRAYAGRAGGKPPGDLPGALDALTRGGASRSEIAAFKKDVAAALGVSVRQVQRMTTQTGTERRGTDRHREELQKLAGAHPKVRGASVSSRRVARMSNQGGRIRINGKQGPKGAKDYKRDRLLERDVQPEQMQAMRDAWLAGDDARVAEIISDVISGSPGMPRDWEWDDNAVIDILGDRRDR